VQGANDDATGQWQSGFFDRGSFMELLGGWARTVGKAISYSPACVMCINALHCMTCDVCHVTVVGRARLGGYPMGVIAVETRSIEDTVPADPAAPESKEQVCLRQNPVM